MKLSYRAEVTNEGELIWTSKNVFKQDLKAFSGKKIIITVERATKKRSLAQNSYLHGVVIPIIKAALLDLGWQQARDDEWVKDYIKYQVLIKEYISDNGEAVKGLGKTSGITTTEFMDMIADIQQFAAEKLNCYVPDPNEQTKMEL